ncbi:arf-GAP with dual PH domain-containing protein 2-like isoform X3 [Cebidichthys violaceus]|uniref:arf-GAP with dual PH domain-containing protein 2-like isoform X3 n=1 Tax=Cebidichthys violaceus TaxID=271503 RepID=UPI0035CB0E87
MIPSYSSCGRGEILQPRPFMRSVSLPSSINRNIKTALFLRINGSVQSMKEENSQGKTTSKLIAQFESTLWKKGKDNKQFLKRIFLLSRKDFTLRYFIKEDSKFPKAIISMKDLNAVFQPEKISHAHGLQISYVHDKHTRNLFVYHENGQVIVSLFNAIRATRLAYLRKKHPTLRDNDLIPQITGQCLKEGYMEKTGPTHREPFKKRWFTLCSMNRKLLYFKSPLDATELGAVFIGTESHSYSASESSGRSARGARWHCGVTLHTPERNFVFMCEQEQQQKEWLEAFRKVIAQPMTPEDYANEANMTRGK